MRLAGGPLDEQATSRHLRFMLTSSTTLADDELIELARVGGRAPFEELLRRHDARMRGLAFRLMADRDRMDDVLQVAYLKAHRALPRFRAGRDVGTWLYRIAYNACVDELRTHGGAGRSADGAGEPRAPSDADRVVGAAEVVRRALADLSISQRVTVVLVDGEGFGHREAAEILGVAPGTVASRLHRARVSLRRILGEEVGVGHDIQTDGIVRTALQLLPVPPHADDFWTRSEARLDREDPIPRDDTARRPMVAAPARAAVSHPTADRATDPAAALLPRSLRRASNLLLLMVAVAAAVVAVWAGRTLLEERNETQRELPIEQTQADPSISSPLLDIV